MDKDHPQKLIWHKVLDNPKGLPEGRVQTVTAGHQSFCLTHHKGKMACLDNKCPHQGGPLGEGSIENGMLRCPWHGWDFDPLTGQPPGGYDDGVATFPVEIREDGVYIGLPQEEEHKKTITDLMVDTMINWGVEVGFGMVGHSNLGLADAMRRAEEKDQFRFFGIRHEGAASFAASAYGKLTGRPAVCFFHRRPRSHQHVHRLVGRQGRPCAHPGPNRTGRHTGRRYRQLPGSGPGEGLPDRRRFQPPRPAR
jgi:pyruvate oxidase